MFSVPGRRDATARGAEQIALEAFDVCISGSTRSTPVMPT
jgi:hypothetical protein